MPCPLKYFELHKNERNEKARQPVIYKFNITVSKLCIYVFRNYSEINVQNMICSFFIYILGAWGLTNVDMQEMNEAFSFIKYTVSGSDYTA